MVAVLPLAQHLQEQVQFRGRSNFQPSGNRGNCDHVMSRQKTRTISARKPFSSVPRESEIRDESKPFPILFLRLAGLTLRPDPITLATAVVLSLMKDRRNMEF